MMHLHAFQITKLFIQFQLEQIHNAFNSLTSKNSAQVMVKFIAINLLLCSPFGDIVNKETNRASKQRHERNCIVCFQYQTLQICYVTINCTDFPWRQEVSRGIKVNKPITFPSKTFIDLYGSFYWSVIYCVNIDNSWIICKRRTEGSWIKKWLGDFGFPRSLSTN